MNSEVLVILLNYNQNEYTINCIDSILKSTYSNFRILLIDNGSEFQNFNKLADLYTGYEKVTVKRIDKNIGYVGGVNYGLQYGLAFRADYFLILNNDTVIDDVAIYELMDVLNRYFDRAIVSGKVYEFGDDNILQDIGRKLVKPNLLKYERVGFHEKDNGQYDKECERDMLDDVFWLFHKSLIEMIGGYSDFFWFNGEQADFALRAKKSGYKLIYAPKAKIWHKGSVSIGGRDRNPKQAYFTIQSSLLLRFLHLKKKHFLRFYLLTLVSVLSTLVKAIFTIFRKDFKENIKYALAKMFAMHYFNTWLFLRNKNVGSYPFK
jgi:GT2 family glycosyltransferase